MKKKPIIIAVVAVVLIVAVLIAYVALGSQTVEVQTHSYLLDKGYTNEDISTIKVHHSFIDLIVSNVEWTSTVVFTDEPNTKHRFVWKNETIISQADYDKSLN